MDYFNLTFFFIFTESEDEIVQSIVQSLFCRPDLGTGLDGEGSGSLILESASV